MRIPTLAAAIIAFGLSAAPAFAQDSAAADGAVEIGDLVISGFWARATLPGQTVGGGYMTIKNTGSEDDRLVTLTSPVTERAEIHEMAMEDEVMTMRRIEGGLALPAGETVALAPGGYHLMFQYLTEGLVEGETVAVTLTFETTGPVTLDLPVLPAGTRGAGGDEQQHHH